MIKLFLFFSVTVLTFQVYPANAQDINFAKRQNAIYYFQATHQRICSLVPKTCDLPTLQMNDMVPIVHYFSGTTE